MDVVASRGPAQLRFRFAGARYEGRAGETLAAALVRNGVLGGFRSGGRGRPRGVYSAHEEEPNALVRVWFEPLLRATLVELEDGLVAEPLCGKGRLAAASWRSITCSEPRWAYELKASMPAPSTSSPLCAWLT